MTRTMTPGSLPDAIVSDLEAARSREEFDAICKSAYMSGWTLRQIGDALGVTREAIRLRLKRPVDPALVKYYRPPVLSPTASERARRRLDNRRVLGFKRSHPVLSIPVADLNRIAELHALVTQNRGWTPLDAPSRKAIPEFGELLMRVHTEYGIPQRSLGRVFGLYAGTFDMWLRLHGYLPTPPSQKAYRGVFFQGGKEIAS